MQEVARKEALQRQVIEEGRDLRDSSVQVDLAVEVRSGHRYDCEGSIEGCASGGR